MSGAEKFKEDLLVILDLLNRKYLVYGNQKSKITVGIFANDLKTYGLNLESFAEALYYLAEQNKQIKIVKQFDEDDLLIDEESSYFDIELTDFPNVYSKIQKQFSKNSGPITNKIDIFFSDDQGLYIYNDKNETLSYPINGKRQQIIKLLLSAQAPIQLVSLYKGNYSELNKAIKDINKILKNKLNLTEDLIIKVQRRGSKVNDRYNLLGV